MKQTLIALLLCLTIFPTFAANRTVTGTVIGKEDKMPLIAATVFVPTAELQRVGSAQTSLGVITDLDGHFSISIPEGVTQLQCTYLGYATQTIALTSAKNYHVVMDAESTLLGDVVVTGYQRIEKRKLTAAVATVDVSAEKVGTVLSVDQALSGQIAGLSTVSTSGAPGAPVKIRIRGTSSLNGTQDPLWVLDGIPMEGTDIPTMEELSDIDNIYSSSIAGINPADIENITVLKDAAATAIYGARAANGVIVITTKSGKKGKPKITFSSRVSYSPNIDLSRLNMLTSAEKVGLELDLLGSSYNYRESKGGVYNILNNYGLVNAYKTGGWNALSSDAQTDINALKAINTDWNNGLFRSAFSQEYNLSLSGGTENATYYTSLGYYDEAGNVIGVDANRFNVVGKTTYKVNNMLSFGVSLFANQRKNSSYLTDADSFTSPTFYSRHANPYQLLYDEDGNYVYDNNIAGKGDDEIADFNIYEERYNTSNENTTQSLSSIFDVELKLNDNFKVTSQVGLQLDNTSIEKIADKESYAMRKERRKTRQASLNDESYLPDGGFHKQYENKSSQITWKTMAEYRVRLNDMHEIEAMAGNELRRTWYQTLYTAGYGFDRRTLTTLPVIFPNEEQAKNLPLHTKSFLENAYASWFATFSYSLKQRYTLGGSIRFDGSDLFGVDKKYRYLPLYSVSGLWRVSGEEFMQDVAWIDNLSLRTSYGLQGNIDKNTSPFVTGTYDNVQILPGTNEPAIEVTSPPNDKLRWEKTQSFNVGGDFSILNQAISLSADYYHRYSSDLIGIRMTPLESGFASTTVNWASLRNQGVEVSLTTRNIHTKNFMWFTNFNFAYNENTILQMSVPSNQTTPSLEGYPVGAIFAYPSAGIDSEGYPLFRNAAGEAVTATDYFGMEQNTNGYGSSLTAEEHRNLFNYMGSSEPPYTGGLTNTFTYKRWELGINCIFNLGQYVQTQPSYSITAYDRGMNTNRDILDRWTPTNPSGTLPGLIINNNPDRQGDFAAFDDMNYYASMDTWVKRLDYMRLQSVRLSYKMPESWLKTFRLASGSLTLEGRNLAVFSTDYTNYLDPETMGNIYAQPIPKSVTFNINLNF